MLYMRGDQVVFLRAVGEDLRDFRYLRIYGNHEGTKYLLWSDARNGIIGSIPHKDAEHALRLATEAEKVLYYKKKNPFTLEFIEICVTVDGISQK